jgi:3-oxoacyl-[acyl-carrier protein] reductase
MSESQELAGRVAIVTGSARNIGRAIAIELAMAGAAVVVNARSSQAEADATVDSICKAGGRAVVKLADVTDPKDVAALVRTAVDRFGRLDILVNNAGVRRETKFADMTYAEWREILAIILDAAFLCAHEALPHLIAAKHGAIVNIGGLSAHTGSAARAHVLAAKMGVVGLTRALAHDLAPEGITVNCVSPGLIDTARNASSTSGGAPAHHAAHAPLVGRRGRPEEIASLVRYLAGPNARYITGQTIHANGGIFMP